MVEITAQVRQWGRSVGVVIPKEAVSKTYIKIGDKVKLFIMSKSSPLKETFGILRLKRSTASILREVDREGWNG